jgi:nitroreductase
LQCGHCAAVCPRSAVHLDGVSDVIVTGKGPNPDLDTVVRVMRHRRSCRVFKETAVARPVLENLVRIGTTAPSGTNSQRWAFTVIPDRPAIEAFAAAVAQYYKRLNSLARNPVVRMFSRWFTKDELGAYYRRYYDSVEEAIDAFENEGRDRLFHGATAGIVVSVGKGASCPKEDALLATQNILLAAQTMGLGSCLIGFAAEAIKRDRGIPRALGIPEDERVFAVIAIGHPAVRYVRPAGRREPTIRFFEGGYKLG